jgi:hypothetical protein
MVNIESVLWWVGGVEMPAGDPEDALLAAKYWGNIADLLEGFLERATEFASRYGWGDNSGSDIDAFHDFWDHHFRPSVSEVAEYCRRIETSCNAYAKALKELKFAFTILAIQTYVNIAFTIGFGWITGWAGTFAELAIIRARAFAGATAAKTLFEQIVMRILQYLIDSIFYATGQQVLQLGVFTVGNQFGRYNAQTNAVFGFNPYSFNANGIQFVRGVGDNMAFDGMDGAFNGLTVIGPLRRYLAFGPRGGLRTRIMKFGGRMAGSEAFTIMNNLEQGKPVQQLAPTTSEQVDKIIIHGARILKDPARGPIGGRLLGRE